MGTPLGEWHLNTPSFKLGLPLHSQSFNSCAVSKQVGSLPRFHNKIAWEISSSTCDGHILNTLISWGLQGRPGVTLTISKLHLEVINAYAKLWKCLFQSWISASRVTLAVFWRQFLGHFWLIGWSVLQGWWTVFSISSSSSSQFFTHLEIYLCLFCFSHYSSSFGSTFWSWSLNCFSGISLAMLYCRNIQKQRPTQPIKSCLVTFSVGERRPQPCW